MGCIDSKRDGVWSVLLADLCKVKPFMFETSSFSPLGSVVSSGLCLAAESDRECKGALLCVLSLLSLD